MTAEEKQAEMWYVTTDWFKDGGKVVVGPFTTQHDALIARDYAERIERRPGRYYVDSRTPVVWAGTFKTP